MESIKKYWIWIVAVIAAWFLFKNYGTKKRRNLTKRKRQKRRAMRNRLRAGNWDKKMPTFRGMYSFSRSEKGMSRRKAFISAMKAKFKRRK